MAAAKTAGQTTVAMTPVWSLRRAGAGGRDCKDNAQENSIYCSSPFKGSAVC